jgi:ABC-type bacteriocin/lantibiotic exporter with double-glycine peptidase domain
MQKTADDSANETAPGFGWVLVLCRNLVPVFRPHRRALIIVVVLMLVELGLQMAQRKAFTTLIDDAILQSQVSLMVLILGLLLAASITRSTVRTVAACALRFSISGVTRATMPGLI